MDKPIRLPLPFSLRTGKVTGNFENLTAVFDRFVLNSGKRRLILLFSDVYPIIKALIRQSLSTSGRKRRPALGP
jgi:hypothetical protein